MNESRNLGKAPPKMAGEIYADFNHHPFDWYRILAGVAIAASSALVGWSIWVLVNGGVR